MEENMVEKKRLNSFFSARNIKWVLLVLDVALLAFFILKYVYKINHLVTLTYDEEHIVSYNENGMIGGSIDESSESGVYDVVPEEVFPKGDYIYRVRFEGESPESYISPISYNPAYHSYSSGAIYLSRSNDGAEKMLHVYRDTLVGLRIIYSGEGSIRIKEYSIQETGALASRMLVTSIFFLCVVNALVIFWALRDKIENRNRLVLLFFMLTGIVLLASYPALTKVTLAGNDMEFHMARIESLKDGLLDGQFPVRISPDFYSGYGYANSVFYGEILLFIPALLRMAGFSLSWVYHFYIICINALTVFGGFWAFRKILKKDGFALVATVLYAMAPYRLNNLYVRSAVGEYTAMAFLPLVLCGMYLIYTEEDSSKAFRRSWIPLTVGLSGIIQSHTLSVEMAGVMILLTCLILIPLTIRKKRFFVLLKSAVLTVLLNIWFILPILDYAKNMDIRFIATSGQKMIQTTGAYFVQLFNQFPIYATSSPDAGAGFRDDFPISLGPAMMFGLLLCLAAVFLKRKSQAEEEEKMQKKNALKERLTASILVFLGILSTWMATIYFPWDSLCSKGKFAATLVSSIQFSWRFLSIASLFAAVATGFGLLILQREKKEVANGIAAVLCGLSVIGGLWIIQTNLQNATLHEYTDLDSLQFGTTTAAMGGEFVLSKARHEIVTEVLVPEEGNKAEVLKWKKSGTHISLDVQSGGEGGYVDLPLLNYKGYVASGDGGINTGYLSEGDAARIRLNLPAGYAGHVEVFFRSPWYWRAAEIVSLLTLLGIIFITVFFERRRQKEVSGN